MFLKSAVKRMNAFGPQEMQDGAVSKKIKVDEGVHFDPATNGGFQRDVTYSEADSSSEFVEDPMNSFKGSTVADKLGNGDGIANPLTSVGDPEPSTSNGSNGEPLKAILDFIEPQYVDEKTYRQMEGIEREIKENVPLISEREELSVLEDEYADDPVYIQKIMDLRTKYVGLRRTRGDGNCFYRSLGFSIFENFVKLGDKTKVEIFQKFMTDCCAEIVELGYNKFTMDDFNEQLSRVMGNPTEQELLDVFQDQGCSDFIVVWLRFLTVLQLRKDPDFYGNFIESHANVMEFCRAEVEPMYRESDHIHIIGIASLLKMKIRVEYVDRGDNPTVISHDFPEDENAPEIFLLYRPGHYDVLYPHNSS